MVPAGSILKTRPPSPPATKTFSKPSSFSLLTGEVRIPRVAAALFLTPAAILAQDNIKKVEVLEYPELGMEAIYRIEVEDFPAFILVDDKGNDFFEKLS